MESKTRFSRSRRAVSSCSGSRGTAKSTWLRDVWKDAIRSSCHGRWRLGSFPSENYAALSWDPASANGRSLVYSVRRIPPRSRSSLLPRRNVIMQLLDSLTAVPAPLTNDEDGVVRVRGSRVRLESVLQAFQCGSSPEEIVLKYPVLNLTDVYSVIAYYLWHRDEVNAYLKRRAEHVDSVSQENEVRFPSSGIRRQLLERRAEQE